MCLTCFECPLCRSYVDAWPHELLSCFAARQGGRMSQYLERMALGDTIDVKGPLGHFIYEGRGYYRSHGTPGFTTRMSMIAGGTGITPMFQVIKVRATLWCSPKENPMFCSVWPHMALLCVLAPRACSLKP